MVFRWFSDFGHQWSTMVLKIDTQKLSTAWADHFLKLCHEGQLEPPVCDDKCDFSTKKDHFLKLRQKQGSYHIFVNMFQELFDKKQCSLYETNK